MNTLQSSDGSSALNNAAGRRHLQRVAALPCSICGAEYNVQAHHPRGIMWACGMGRKAPDDTAIPLCTVHHDEYHRHGRHTWEVKHGAHAEHLEKTVRLLEKVRI
jgi:hypothetical protein